MKLLHTNHRNALSNRRATPNHEQNSSPIVLIITMAAQMNVRPLIVRELRAEARRSSTYWLRALAAALLTALFVWSAWNFRTNATALGPLLFNALSNGLLLSVLI